MEELSIAEKAMRYDVAVKKAKSKITGDKDHVLYEDDVIEMFPELKGSVDELTWLKKYIGEEIDCLSVDIRDEEDRAKLENLQRSLAWLEKQGEQSPVVIIPKFRVGDVIRIKGSNAEYLITEISDGYYRGSGWCLHIIEGDKSDDYELVEQNSSWGEEDERMLDEIIDFFENGTVKLQHDLSLYASWLKFIKNRVQPQNTWKPSDEQMKALSAINVTGGISYAGQGQELINLYNDLKKLKE